MMIHVDTPLVEVNLAIISLVVQTKKQKRKNRNARTYERSEPQSKVPSVALVKKRQERLQKLRNKNKEFLTKHQNKKIEDRLREGLENEKNQNRQELKNAKANLWKLWIPLQ